MPHGFADSLPWFEAALRRRPPQPADAWAEYAATLGDFGASPSDMLKAVRVLIRDRAGGPAGVLSPGGWLAQRGGKPPVLARSLLERSGNDGAGAFRLRCCLTR